MSSLVFVRAGTVASSVLIAAGCVVGDVGLSARDSVTETRALRSDGRFTLENVNGRVVVRTWAEPRVRIEAERAAASSHALDEVRVEIDGEGGRVDVHTRLPRSGVWPLGGGSGRVDYRITLPAGVQLELKTVNGGVEVEGVVGGLQVSSVNGGIEIRGANGPVHATTVNGGIHAQYGAAPTGGRHRISTTNGGVSVMLPEGTGGRLEGRTVNGSVSCELPLEVREKKRRLLEGTLGPGEASFDLRTVNGSIRVLRAGGAQS
jgi:hypothetical protein